MSMPSAGTTVGTAVASAESIEVGTDSWAFAVAASFGLREELMMKRRDADVLHDEISRAARRYKHVDT